MREITLSDITDEQLASQAQLLINMLRTKYPKLDLRRGTVLRDLLVDADSAVGAMFSAQADEQRESSSLLTLSERANAGESVDEEDINAALSNFNMASISGTKAKGYVRVFVNTENDHTVLAGCRFYTNDGIYFTSTSDVVASLNPISDEVKQYKGTSNWWFLVPVEADEVGSNGNLTQGTALDSETAIADFVSAAVYKTFSGGSSLEAIDKTVARIKASLSVRSLTTEVAVESQLRDNYDDTDNPIVAVSLCGYANEAQHRDKHNLFGTSVGGRVDLYVRNFTELPVAPKLTKAGKYNPDTGTFTLDISHEDIPGIISIYSVSDPDSAALSSYLFDVKYSGDVSNSWHDFDVSENYSEIANTVWRDATVTVKDAEPTEEELEAGEKMFRVEAVALPAADSIQAYVSVNAVVRHSYAVDFDVDVAISKICEYVNTTGFVGRLTRSEIASILIDLGATSVDLFEENDMLYGYAYDAFGNKIEMSGDALDVEVAKSPKGMFTKDTAVFVLEPKNVQIKTIPIS